MRITELMLLLLLLLLLEGIGNISIVAAFFSRYFDKKRRDTFIGNK